MRPHSIGEVKSFRCKDDCLVKHVDRSGFWWRFGNRACDKLEVSQESVKSLKNTGKNGNVGGLAGFHADANFSNGIGVFIRRSRLSPQDVMRIGKNDFRCKPTVDAFVSSIPFGSRKGHGWLIGRV